MIVVYKNSNSSQEAFEILKREVTEKKLADFKVQANMNYDHENLVVSAKGKGFTFQVSCMKDSCKVTFDFSLLLRPFKTKILSRLEEELSRIL